jgi:hypothetical protein
VGQEVKEQPSTFSSVLEAAKEFYSVGAIKSPTIFYFCDFL